MHVGMNPNEFETESNYDVRSAFGDNPQPLVMG